MAPKGNRIARNIVAGGTWGDIEKKAEPMVRFVDNLRDTDPKFRDPAKDDYELLPERVTKPRGDDARGDVHAGARRKVDDYAHGARRIVGGRRIKERYRR